MNSKQKEQYLTPIIEVIEMQTEGGVMIGSATSGSISTPGVGDGGDVNFSSTRNGTYNGASSSELEDLINDILTIEQ